MYGSTDFLINHIRDELKIWRRIKSQADADDIARIISDSIKSKKGFEYISHQRPDGDVYRELMRLDAGAQRNSYINKRRDKKSIYELAERDIQSLMQDRSAGVSEAFAFGVLKKGSRAMEQRQADLSLCLTVSPALTCDQVNTVLWKFFGEAPLHLRNPIDVIYSFVFQARDAQAAGFETLQAQQQCVRELMTFADDVCRWGIGEEKNEAEEEKSESLPDTKLLKEEFAKLEPGNREEFIEWFQEQIDSMDIRDRRYSVRKHFSNNLLRIANAQDAARRGVKLGGIFEDWYNRQQDEGTGMALFAEGFPIEKLTDGFYSGKKVKIGETQLKDVADEDFADIIEYMLNGGAKPQVMMKERERKEEGLPAVERSDVKESEEQAKQKREISMLKGMEIATWSIGLEFYALWHEIGVQFAVDCKDGLPENFPDARRWNQYIRKLNEAAQSANEAVSEYMEEEPDFLWALRDYAERYPKGNESLLRDIESVQEAQQRFEQLLGGEGIVQYIMSQWHYACITDKGKRKSKDSAVRDAADEKSLRLVRLTSRSHKIVSVSSSEVVDTPKSLLILSELAAQNARTGRKVKALGLIEHIDEMLGEYGYPLLDIRKPFDYMIYCAVRMAEQSSNDSNVLFEEVFDGLYQAIEEYSFRSCTYLLEKIARRDRANMDAVLQEKYGIEMEPVQRRKELR